MNRMLTMLAAAVMAVAAMFTPLGAWADTETVNGYEWTYSITSDGKAEIGVEARPGLHGVAAISPSPTGAVTIPSMLGGRPVTRIRSWAFYNCSGLTSVTIPDGVTSIGDEAFQWCRGLMNLTIPSNVTSIGDRAFYGCSGLTSVTIGNGVTSIGWDAFSGCSSLTSLTIGNSVTSIGSSAFRSCSGLTSVTIPDSVMIIGSEAFYGCSGLTSVTMGNGVTNIWNSAFPRCSALMKIEVGAENSVYKSVNGLLLSKDGRTLIRGVNGVVTIPDSVTCIGGAAFEGCSGLTSVTIPDSVTNIGGTAFSACQSLAKVKLGTGVKNIGTRAFKGCNQLTSVALPDGLENIGNEAFCECDLDEVFLPKSVISMGHGAFYGCGELAGLVIGENTATLGAGVFAENRNLQIVRFRGKPPEAHIGWESGQWYSRPAQPALIATPKPTGSDNGWANYQAALKNYEARLDFARTWPNVFIIQFSSIAAKDVFDTTPCAIGYYRKRYSPEWEAVIDSNGKWQGLTMLEMPYDEIIITLDPAGGDLSYRRGLLQSGYAIGGELLIPVRPGCRFDGWFTAPSGGEIVTSRTVPTRDVTYYAHWTFLSASVPVSSSPGGASASIASGMATTPHRPRHFGAGTLKASFPKAQTVTGALYAGDMFVGKVQVKVGKVGAKGTVKVSASATLLAGGKTKTVSAKAATLTRTADGSMGGTLAFKAPIGEMMFEMTEDGVFTLENAAYTMEAATVGGALAGGAHGMFRLADFELTMGEVQDDLLPYEENFIVAGGKWKFAKPAVVKWAQDKKTKVFELTVDDTKGKANLSGLKLSYAPKTGLFKGTFRAYALVTAADKTKLARYMVNVIGFVVDGWGEGEASCKKPTGGPWAVTVE